jgi:hypothetical protein
MFNFKQILVVLDVTGAPEVQFDFLDSFGNLSFDFLKRNCFIFRLIIAFCNSVACKPINLLSLTSHQFRSLNDEC